jgi:3-deoxy-manno-octulosonate cytidylyltransferase (CMP-KDO synthetase)
VKTLCVIPARYASTRLPGKPLVKIGGSTMIERVYKRARQVKDIDEVIVATDDERILQTVEKFGGIAVMTDPALPSGTDRVYQAIREKNAGIIVNLQGDEPFVEPDVLHKLVQVFENDQIQIATPVCKIDNDGEYHNPNVVKVVRDAEGFALYFSRSQIPFFRDWKEQKSNGGGICYKHIGIYAYRKECLAQLTRLNESTLEKAEKLEQLRFLEHGYRIYTVLTDYNSISVDTEDDLEKINRMIRNNEL